MKRTIIRNESPPEVVEVYKVESKVNVYKDDGGENRPRLLHLLHKAERELCYYIPTEDLQFVDSRNLSAYSYLAQMHQNKFRNRDELTSYKADVFGTEKVYRFTPNYVFG